jgi:deoxyxylulose-5-phosphate synthase
LRAVADELRAYLIESVGKSGGHFAAGLGVIELTVALHYLYQTPHDQLVWDVGHQTYPHKILTGRRDEIHTVKQKDGVAPFPKREESEYDTFGVGHSSTSISAALGMAIARQSEGDDRKVVAVIGDGAMTAGMATQGGKPVVAIYSTFLQRAYDQLVHDVAIKDLDVLFAIDRAGVVGPDGATHAGNLDLSFLRCVPNLVVMAPSNEAECRQMLSTGLQHPGPAAVRYPRGTGTGVAAGTDLSTLPIGKGELRLQGSRIALLAFGSTVAAAEQVGRELGLSVVNMRFIKPLDRELVLAMAAQHEGLVTIEDNVVAGGAGSGVGELLNAEGVLRPILHLGLPDSYQHHASREDLLAEAGIDASGIRAAVLKRWPQLASGTPPLSAAS